MSSTHLPMSFQYQNDSAIDPFLNIRNSSTPRRHIHNTTDPPIIRDVWEDNFEEEFNRIMQLVDKYKVIGMDTEFPGLVYRLNQNDINAMGNYSEIEYKTVKMNVDKLKVIQIGISLADDEGYLPDGITTWQFNFKFDLNMDEYAKDAIELLSNSGLNFVEHAKRGLNPKLFAEYLIGSGLILNDDIKWISFHGGFDFAYIIRMLNNQSLPVDEAGFYNLLSTYFPLFYDIKYMIRDISSMKGSGLNKIAGDLNVRRIGPQHQAGSDSLLTLSIYFKLKEVYFRNVSDLRHGNVLYGIGTNSDEGLNDYVWPVSDYPTTMFNGYPMSNIPIMNASPYQNEPSFNTLANNYYNMHYNVVYNNFGSTFFIDNNKNPRKYDSPMGKTKAVNRT